MWTSATLTIFCGIANADIPSEKAKQIQCKDRVGHPRIVYKLFVVAFNPETNLLENQSYDTHFL